MVRRQGKACRRRGQKKYRTLKRKMDREANKPIALNSTEVLRPKSEISAPVRDSMKQQGKGHEYRNTNTQIFTNLPDNPLPEESELMTVNVKTEEDFLVSSARTNRGRGRPKNIMKIKGALQKSPLRGRGRSPAQEAPNTRKTTRKASLESLASEMKRQFPVTKSLEEEYCFQCGLPPRELSEKLQNHLENLQRCRDNIEIGWKVLQQCRDEAQIKPEEHNEEDHLEQEMFYHDQEEKINEAENFCVAKLLEFERDPFCSCEDLGPSKSL